MNQGQIQRGFGGVAQTTSAPPIGFWAEIFYFNVDDGQKVGNYHATTLRRSQKNPLSGNLARKKSKRNKYHYWEPVTKVQGTMIIIGNQ